MTAFKPTHEINLVSTITAKVEHVRVMLVAEQDGSGPAYTREEWDADATADWERDTNGRWWFKGEVAPPSRTATVRALPAQ